MEDMTHSHTLSETTGTVYQNIIGLIDFEEFTENPPLIINWRKQSLNGVPQTVEIP